jgi:hypothetical protein
VTHPPTDPATPQRQLLEHQLLHALARQHGLAIHELPGAVLAHSPSHPHTGYVHINRHTGQVTHLHPQHLGYFTLYPNPHDPTAPPVGLDTITTALTRPAAAGGGGGGGGGGGDDPR